MKVLIVTVGVPGSGKSYSLREYEDMVVCPDTLRILNGCLMPYQSMNKIDIKKDRAVWKQVMEILENRFSMGQTTILDSTGLYNLSNIKALCKKYRYRMIQVIYDSNSFETCKQNVKQRKYGNFIPDEVLLKFEGRMKEYGKKEQVPGVLYKTSNYDNQSDAIKDVMSYIIYEEDLSRFDKLKIIPDIHGMYDCFEKFIKQENNFEDNSIGYIFLGDYIDRGNRNKEMIDFLLNFVGKKDNMFFLIGNHDERLLNWVNDISVEGSTFYNITRPEIESYFSNEEELKKYKSDIREIGNKMKLYIFANFHGQKYFFNHSGVDNFDYKTPANYLTGKDTYGYVKDTDPYESYIDVLEAWGDYHPDIIQIIGHRNCMPALLEDGHKVNKNGYCMECNIEYGSDLSIMIIDKNNKVSYEKIKNEVKDLNGLGHGVKQLIREKYFEKEGIFSVNFDRKVFYKALWNSITLKARGLYKEIGTGKILGRSYNKFFNLDEMVESRLEEWKKDVKYPVLFYKKENGYLLICFYNPKLDRIEYATKSVLCDKNYNLWAEKLFTEEQKNILYDRCKKDNVSFVFEVICKKDNEHPIVYDEEKVILLDVIKNEDNFILDHRIEDYENFNHKLLLDVAENEKELEELVLKYKNSLDIDFEGVVLEDSKAVNRKHLKIKSVFYNVKKKLRSLSFSKENETNLKSIGNEYLGVDISPIVEYLVNGRGLKRWRELTVEEFKGLINGREK